MSDKQKDTQRKLQDIHVNVSKYATVEWRLWFVVITRFFISCPLLWRKEKTHFHFYFHFHLYIRDVTAGNISKVKIKQRVEPKSTFISTWNGPLQVDCVIEKKWGIYKQRRGKNSIICHNLPLNVPKLAENFY